MKKILAIVLALVMVFALAACGGGGNTPAPSGGGSTPATQAPSGGGTAPSGRGTATSGGGDAASGKASPNCNPDGSVNLDKVAHFDPEYDYSQNPRMKCCYISSASGPLYQQSADAYEVWCKQLNLEWMGFSSAEGDNDMYMTLLQNQIDQGCEILILDPDNTIFPTVAALMDQYPDCAWMSQMSPARDADASAPVVGGNLINPSVGFSHYDAGWQEMEKLFDWFKATYPNADWSEVALLSMDYSISPPLHERTQAGLDYWAQNAPAEAKDNAFVGDCAASGISLQAGIDVAGPIVSTNGNIKYWLVQGNVDDWAQGAAQVVEQAGLGDNSCVVTFGGSALQMQWDAGQQDCFRFALFTAQTLYAEPIIGACYAFKMGWATPDTIWPSWINNHDHGADGHTYASLRLPTVWLEPETYKNYLEWTDLYAGVDQYPYNDVKVELDDYTAFVDEVPAEYA